MAKVSRNHASQIETMEGFEGRYEQLDGYTVAFETYTQDADPAPYFVGLPGDRCQCPHWGVVLRGTLTYDHADGSQDVIGAGEAYYVAPGHLPFLYAGTEVIEFSPTKELKETLAVIERNMAGGA